MSKTEALRTQLDALQVQHNALQAQNRKLREDEIDLESELAVTREENIRLSQTVTRLEASIVQKEETEERTAELRESVESLTHETATLRGQREELASRLAESQSELEAMTARLEAAEDYSRRVEEDRERTEREAEPVTLRAVARETQKWEAREARLLKRLDELQCESPTSKGPSSRTPTAGDDSTTNGEEESRSGGADSQRQMPVTEHSIHLSDEENQMLYGKCYNTNGHGHNYTVKVTLKGKVDEKTGMVFNIAELKHVLQVVILEHLDHKNLDLDVTYFKDHISTTENLTIYIWDELKKALGDRSELLFEVLIHETDNNIFYYRGE